jgi:hypothetical protein
MAISFIRQSSVPLSSINYERNFIWKIFVNIVYWPMVSKPSTALLSQTSWENECIIQLVSSWIIAIEQNFQFEQVIILTYDISPILTIRPTTFTTELNGVTMRYDDFNTSWIYHANSQVESTNRTWKWKQLKDQKYCDKRVIFKVTNTVHNYACILPGELFISIDNCWEHM